MAENQLAQVAPRDQAPALAVREQVNQIQYLMASVLKSGTHYGVIKGTDKPTLLQPGAEKIAYMFKLVPSYKVEREQLGGGHREYNVECTLTNRESGEVMGFGVGECSTMESKYRYRWEGRYPDRRRVENPDIADVWNTCLKMAKKRAFVDAVKSTTAASDVFTQDIEDLPEYAAPEQPAPQPVAAQVAPVADLGPVRSRFKAYTGAYGLTPKQGMAAVCQAVGAASMKSMTQDQADRAAAWIDSQMAAASAVHDAEQDAHAGDAEAEAIEAAEVEIADADIEGW